MNPISDKMTNISNMVLYFLLTYDVLVTNLNIVNSDIDIFRKNILDANGGD